MSTPLALTDEGKKLVFDVHRIVNLDPGLQESFRKLIREATVVINSMEMKRRCLNYGYSYTTSSGMWWWKKVSRHSVVGFKSNNGHSPSKIWSNFASGRDRFNTSADGDIDLYITFYFSNNGVIGYTYGNTYRTWVNTKFFLHRLKSPEGRAKIIGNIIHEYMHNLGYGHAVRWNSTRKHTVPYAYGYIAEQVALETVYRRY